jgi:hypothetical protein
MASIIVKLRLVSLSKYALFSIDGIQISGIFRGSRDDARAWAEAFCSTWSNWTVDYKEIDEDEEKSRILESLI